MRQISRQNMFKRDFKVAGRRGKDLTKLKEVIDLLVVDGALPLTLFPHKLSGEFSGLWECHIETDWLLIYDVDEEEVKLIRTGTHSDLFG